LKIFRYIFLTQKKNQLSEELELSKLYKKSSDLASIMDLIKKLNEAIIKNRKELNYLEEDYFQQKNQINQIKKELRNYDLQIQDINETKKECFSQINSITRQIEGSLNGYKNDSIAKLGINVNLTNAEKIRALQKKAKEAQYEIKQIQSRSNETKVKLENLTPHYEIYKNDYEELLETIKKDEKRIEDVKSNYEKKRKDNIDSPDEEPENLMLKPVRISVEIEDEIGKTNSELDKISIPEDTFNFHNLSDLTLIIEKLSEFDNTLKIGSDKINISTNEKEVAKSFENFKNFEIIINDLEILLNNFLKEIQNFIE
jgi:chromosome segregation ATPase